MLRHHRGLRRTLAAFAAISVLMLPVVQLAHADVMARMGMGHCHAGMAMPAGADMSGNAGATPGAPGHPANHHGCCCDCCSCCVETVVLPSAHSIGGLQVAAPVLSPLARRIPVATPQLVDHLLPFSQAPPPSA